MTTKQTSALLLAALASSWWSSGCATDSTFVVEHAPAGSSLVVEDRYHPLTPGEPLLVSVPAGDQPVRWRVEKDVGVLVGEGTVPRTDIEWPVVVFGTAAAACCMPGGALLGFCLANPAVLALPLAALTGNVGGSVAALDSPTWTTIPFTVAGAALGATPLLLAMVAQSPADVITLALPVPTTPVPTTPVAAPPVPAPDEATPTTDAAGAASATTNETGMSF